MSELHNAAAMWVYHRAYRVGDKRQHWRCKYNHVRYRANTRQDLTPIIKRAMEDHIAAQWRARIME